MPSEESKRRCLSFARLCAMKNSSPVGLTLDSSHASTNAGRSARIPGSADILSALSAKRERSKTSPSLPLRSLTPALKIKHHRRINHASKANGNSRDALQCLTAPLPGENPRGTVEETARHNL